MHMYLFFLSLCDILSHVKQSWKNVPASRQDCLYLNDLSNLLLKLYSDRDSTTSLGKSIA